MPPAEAAGGVTNPAVGSRHAQCCDVVTHCDHYGRSRRVQRGTRTQFTHGRATSQPSARTLLSSRAMLTARLSRSPRRSHPARKPRATRCCVKNI